MIGPPLTIATTAVSAIIGVTCLSAGLSGFLVGRASAWQRVVLVAAAFVLIKPGLATDLVGAALLAVVIASQLATARSIKLRDSA